MDALGNFQFRLLPFGSALLLITVTVAWFRRRQLRLRGATVVFSCGVLGSALVVAALYGLRRLPWAMPCLDCLASSQWFSVALTFVQGCGFVSALVLCYWLVRHNKVGQHAT